LVVNVSSSSSSERRRRDDDWTKFITPRRTSGSPPVSRIFVTPRPTKIEHSRSSSSSRSASACGRNVILSAMQ